MNTINEWNSSDKTMPDALRIIGAGAPARYVTAIKNAAIAGYDYTPEMVVACYMAKVKEGAISPAGAVLFCLNHPADNFDTMEKHANALFGVRQTPVEPHIVPVHDDTVASSAVVTVANMVSDASKVCALITARRNDHHTLFQIQDLYRAMDRAHDALAQLEKQLRAGRASADERQAVAKVKAGMR